MNKLKNKLFYIYSFLLYLLLVLIFILLSDKFIKPMANSFLLSNVTANVEYNKNIFEIIVDDNTAQKYHWSNDPEKIITTELLDYFYTYSKPKVVGLDILYTGIKDDSISQVRGFINQISKMNNLVLGFVPEDDNAGKDERFIKSFENQHALSVTNNIKNKLKSPFNGIVDYSDILRENTNHYGSVIINTDKSTNYVFNSINIVKIKDAYYPSLAFKMYLLANNTNDITIDDKYVTVPKTGLKFRYKYDNGRFLTPIRYYRLFNYGNDENGKSVYTHESIAASNIIDTYKALKQGITPETHPEFYNRKVNPLVNPDIFKDKVVFIGANVSGPNQDVLHTPLHQRQPGVDVQATIYDNLDSQEILQNAGIFVNLFLFLFLCILTFIIIMRAKFIKGLWLLILLDILYLFIVMTFGIFGYVIPYATPLICQFITTVFAYTFKFLNESRNKEQITNAMGKYLSQDVMKNVVKDIENLGLGGKRAVVTVLFSDIRGFTSMSEKMSAEEVSEILNEYFAQMEPIIRKYNGIINKFIGDAIMVIFGEPIQDINHPKNAVKCAYEMLKKVHYLRDKWLEKGRPRFEIGVGINTGEVFIGNIGTENRMEYTAIGDSVNLASRIEGYNKVYKTNLLISASTYNYISDCADVIKIKDVQIRGKAKKMDIYEVLRIDLDK